MLHLKKYSFFYFFKINFLVLRSQNEIRLCMQIFPLFHKECAENISGCQRKNRHFERGKLPRTATQFRDAPARGWDRYMYHSRTFGA